MSRTQRRTPQGTARGLHGFSIVELLIALIIIGILTSVLVPTISHRAEESRLMACKSDLEVIAAAEDRVASDTGYYVRLFALDDLPRGDGIGMARPNLLDKMDGVADEGHSGLAVYNLAFNTAANSIFIRIASQSPDPLLTGPSVVAAADAVPIFSGTLGVDLRTPVTVNSYFAKNWSGPYYTIKKQPRDDIFNPLEIPQLHLRDIPSDPWGNNYMLFFRNGYVQEPIGLVSPTMFIATPNDCVGLFDRPTIVSFGPDGKPGDNGTTRIGDPLSDDLVYSFGY